MTSNCPRMCANCEKWHPLSTPSERAEMLRWGDLKEVFIYDMGICERRVERDFVLDLKSAQSLSADALVDMADGWIKRGGDLCMRYKERGADV